MSNPDNPCVAFKGRMMTLTVLEVRDADVAAIGDSVQQQIERSPGFFARMPVLLSLKDPDVDLAALHELLSGFDLVVVAVLDADEQIAQAARAAGLGLMTSPAGRSASGRGGTGERRGEPESDKPRTAGRGENSARGADNDQQADDEAPPSGSRLVTRPVRSGQQIYARDGDLVITSSVGEGAEVLADGHIHVYGVLRGRALAGASGDTQARIFCRRFEPDLVAIAGCYKVADAIDADLLGARVQVCLENDNLVIELQE